MPMNPRRARILDAMFALVFFLLFLARFSTLSRNQAGSLFDDSVSESMSGDGRILMSLFLTITLALQDFVSGVRLAVLARNGDGDQAGRDARGRRYHVAWTSGFIGAAGNLADIALTHFYELGALVARNAVSGLDIVTSGTLGLLYIACFLPPRQPELDPQAIIPLRAIVADSDADSDSGYDADDDDVDAADAAAGAPAPAPRS